MTIAPKDERVIIGPKNKKEEEIFAIEYFIADVQYAIQKVMNLRRVSRSELAKRLGCSKANITRLLSEDANITVETVARIFHALEDEARISSRHLNKIAKIAARRATDDHRKREQLWVQMGRDETHVLTSSVTPSARGTKWDRVVYANENYRKREVVPQADTKTERSLHSAEAA
jgi:transcriptional regulator with XRE-family HTH domain